MTALSVADLARLSGRNRSTIMKQINDVEYVDGKHGAKMYESTLVLPILYNVAKAGDLDLQAERARLSYHQANKASLEEREASGELVNINEIEKEWISLMAAFRAKMLGMPTKLAAQLCGLETKTEIRAMVNGMIESALEELEDYDPKKAHARPTRNKPASGPSAKRSKKGSATTKANGKPVG